MKTPVALLLFAALYCVPSYGSDEHEHAHMVPEKLGKVHFPISCHSEVRPTFTRALALLHSFAYDEAERTFQEVASKDPACGMAQWGIAMSNFHTIWAPPTETEFKAGREAAERAVKIGSSDAREKDYIKAIGAFYEGENVPHPNRVENYEKAMATVAKRHPKDNEAQIFHALAILGEAYHSPPDKTYRRQKQVAKILNGILKREPEHPGIAHYMIHSFDYPALAKLGLPAARAYAKIAPSAPHALHMPSHIFTRLGMWKESIKSNLASAKAAQEWVSKTKPGATAYDALHAWDYLAYAYLQLGENGNAKDIVDQVSKVTSFDVPQFAVVYALAAIPVRYALERHAWKEAAQLQVRPENFPWKEYPYAEAITHFARAVGGARSGDLETARTAIDRLGELKGELQGKKGFDWATQVEIQKMVGEGWLARAKNENEEAIKILKKASDLEDSTDKHPVTPGPILPAREQLADLLLELGRSREAMAEYRASNKLAPGRLNTSRGLKMAAK